MKTISIFALCLLAMFFELPTANAQVTFGIGMTVRDSPPPLPYYTQPPCPVDGYLWIPGYWANGDGGYYWVPGVWVSPPQPDYLWTPGYWEFSGGLYGFHSGYWGRHVGYYGGVNYGYGYGGSGYYGGRWEGGRFRYNTAVVRVNETVVHNTYVDRAVMVNQPRENRSSFNGVGGIRTRPSAQEEVGMRETHIQPTSEQVSHQQFAGKDRKQFSSVNQGRPATPAMNKVGGQVFNPQGRPATVAAPNPPSRPTNPGQGQQQARPPQQARPQPQEARPQPQQQARSPQQARPQPQEARPQPQQQARPQPKENKESNEPRQGGEGREKRN